jgi:hypothetical protein
MTLKQKIWKVIEWFIGSMFTLASTLAVGLLILNKTNLLATKEAQQEVINNKADIPYVDNKFNDAIKYVDQQDQAIKTEFKEEDAEIRGEIDTKFDDHNLLHSSEFQTLKAKIEGIEGQNKVIVEWIKSLPNYKE